MKRTLGIAALLLAAACAKETGRQSTITAPPPKLAEASPLEISQGLQTPESVMYDADNDVYLISNINGDALAADNNGYISRINPDTLQGDFKWIEGGKNGVTLNAPKGSAVIGDTFYVADITTVRKFDRKSGAPKGEVPIPGSTFLNDLGTDGKSLYLSDSGMKAGAKRFEGTGTDAVWRITNDKPVKIAGGTDLDRPNGVEVVDGHIWVVSFKGNELYEVVNGKKTNVATLPAGSLDGLVHLADGTFLVSSWDSSTVYRGPSSGPFNAVITNVKSPADIGYDVKRKRVMVPHFTESRVTIHPLQ